MNLKRLKYLLIAAIAVGIWSCASSPGTIPRTSATTPANAGGAAGGNAKNVAPNSSTAGTGAGRTGSAESESAAASSGTAPGSGGAVAMNETNRAGSAAAATAANGGSRAAGSQSSGTSGESSGGAGPAGRAGSAATAVGSLGATGGMRETGAALRTEVTAAMAGMTVEQKVGQLLMIAVYDERSGAELRSLTPSFRALYKQIQPGGVVLFGGNIDTVEQTITLTDQIRTLSQVPPFISTDEEGGEVSRLTASGKIDATHIPAAWTIGLTGEPRLAYEAGLVSGSELAAVGINMDLAPDADVLTNPQNHVIGTRSFGNDPNVVAEMVAATVQGLQDAGVSAVLKHFPGHGDTSSDTHVTTAVVQSSLERLNRVELVPFRAGVAAGADIVMTAHIALPRITGNDAPATLSPAIVDDLLRNQMKFRGVVMTDAMNMAAVTDYMKSDEAAVTAILAGCDMILRPPDAEQTFRALLAAVKTGKISEARLDASVARILSVKYARGLYSPASRELPTPAEAKRLIGTTAHRDVVEAIRTAASAGD